MPANYPGADTWHADITGAVALDPAAGTEHGPTAVSQLSNRTRFLANLVNAGNFRIVDQDVATIDDGTSDYVTNDTETGTSFNTMSLVATVDAEEDDIVIAFAQIVGNYTGANFGEFQLFDDKDSERSPRTKLEQSGVDVSCFLTMFKVVGVGDGGTRNVELQGRVETAGTLEHKGSCILFVVVLREGPATP